MLEAPRKALEKRNWRRNCSLAWPLTEPVAWFTVPPTMVTESPAWASSWAMFSSLVTTETSSWLSHSSWASAPTVVPLSRYRESPL